MKTLSPTRVRESFAIPLDCTISKKLWTLASKYSCYQSYGNRSGTGFIRRTQPKILDQTQKQFLIKANEHQYNPTTGGHCAVLVSSERHMIIT
jgi:hypothetical protein